MKHIPQHTLTFLDSWLTFQTKWARLPGLVVVIAKDDVILFNKAYGYANHETGETMTTDHAFRIASQSKTFTATALLQLVEKGMLKLDDPIASHLVWLKDHRDSRWQTVTIRQLLSHSAGVIRDGVDSDYWQLKRAFPDREVLKTEILAADLVKTPNTKMKYSNYGFSVLGLLLEEVTGQSYESYMQEFIIEPLGLASTSTDKKDDLKYATAYSRLTPSGDRHALPNPATHAMAAATGFSSTAADLATYYSAQLIGSGKLLTDESKREMQRKQWPIEGGDAKSWYSLGVQQIKRGERDMVGHGGGFPGTVTETAFDNKDRLVVSVFVNGNGYVGDIINGVITAIDALGENEPDASLLKYEARFANFWTVSQTVATHDGLRTIIPTSWYPFSRAEKLEIVDETTLKIVDADGFSSEGEMVHYFFREDGSIDHIVDAGTYTYVSEDGDVPQTWK